MRWLQLKDSLPSVQLQCICQQVDAEACENRDLPTLMRLDAEKDREDNQIALFSFWIAAFLKPRSQPVHGANIK